MSVSLEHVSLERVIAESGVSRATAYRHFASKSEFLREVLTAVVRATRLEAESPAQIEELLSLVAERQDAQGTAQGRRDLAVEALRRATHADFERIASSPRWRTHLALHATCRGLPESELRTEVRALLADAEARFTAQRARVYERLAGALGYRLVPPLTAPDGFLVMADSAGALMTGLVVRSFSDPGTASRVVRGAAFRSSEEADWTWPAHHLVANLLAHIEPDPAVVWDDERRALTAAAVEEMARAARET